MDERNAIALLVIAGVFVLGWCVRCQRRRGCPMCRRLCMNQGERLQLRMEEQQAHRQVMDNSSRVMDQETVRVRSRQMASNNSVGQDRGGVMTISTFSTSIIDVAERNNESDQPIDIAERNSESDQPTRILTSLGLVRLVRESLAEVPDGCTVPVVARLTQRRSLSLLCASRLLPTIILLNQSVTPSRSQAALTIRTIKTTPGIISTTRE
jgi:hypothetical protein